MQMNDLLAVGNDIIVSAESFLGIIRDSAIENCINTFTPTLKVLPYSWMMHRSNGEIWCFYRTATTSIYRFNGVAMWRTDNVDIDPDFNFTFRSSPVPTDYEWFGKSNTFAFVPQAAGLYEADFTSGNPNHNIRGALRGTEFDIGAYEVPQP